MTALVAAFSNEAALVRAVSRLRAAGFDEIETYTPVPLTVEDNAGPGSVIPAAILFGGLAGAAFMFGLQTLSDASSWGYPVDIGGHPKFSWPGFVPNAVSFGFICASLFGFAALLFLSGAWRLWDAVDEFEAMREASRDGWIAHVHHEETDEIIRAREVIVPLDPLALRVISVDLEEVPT